MRVWGDGGGAAPRRYGFGGIAGGSAPREYGIRVEEIEDPLMQKIRWLDKLIDELAKGKAMEKILRE